MRTGRRPDGIYIEHHRWVTDPVLRGLSAADRQLYLELQVLASGDRDTYGTVAVDGLPGGLSHLARFLGLDLGDLSARLDALVDVGLVVIGGGEIRLSTMLAAARRMAALRSNSSRNRPDSDSDSTRNFPATIADARE